MFQTFSETPEVQHWQWDLAARMRSGIERVYASRPDEVECVRAVVQAIDGTPEIVVKANRRGSFKLSVEAAFLHGARSQVRFQVGGASHHRELADLLVLAGYVNDGSLACQRACLVQAKRSGPSGNQAASRYGVDPWQLALLASFPPFEGISISGVFAGLTVHMRNTSGMLGAYGLLSPPGEVVVVSARVLNQMLGGRKSITSKELVPAILSESAAARSAGRVPEERWWFDPKHCPYCHELAMHIHPRHWHRHHHQHNPFGPSPVDNAPAQSATTCIGLDEFVQSWTGLRLGEVWHAASGARSDRILRTSVQAAVRRVGSATGKLADVMELLDRAGGDDNLRIGHDGPEEDWGGLAVVSVVGRVNRGEG